MLVAGVEKQSASISWRTGHECRSRGRTHPRTIVHLHLCTQDGSKRIGEQSPDHVGAAAPPERLHEHDHTTTDGHATALPDVDGASIDAGFAEPPATHSVAAQLR